MLKKVFIVMLLLGSAMQVQARLVIEITEGIEGALPIAVVPFADEAVSENRVSQIVSADLARSGHFAPIPTAKMSSHPHQGSEIDFAAWRKLGVEHLVVGKVGKRGKSALQVQFQLFDVVSGAQLVGYSIPTVSSRLRQVAHQISDLIFEKLTGQKGAFNTHVAYVTVERTGGKTINRLAVADADGHNEQIILTSKQPLLSPAWAPDGLRLAYVSFEGGRSELFVQDITTGKRVKLASFSGLNSAPAWSPEGRRLAMTLSRDGNPEIYLIDLDSRALSRITRSHAIDTEAAWAVDGRSLIFTSDRGGKPQIYQVELNGNRAKGRPQRLTFESEYSARASFSPDGRRLVFVSGEGNRFRIAVQDMETGAMRVVTGNRLDESPSFAPNGKMIIYATEHNGRGILEAVSVDGRSHQRLGVSQGDVREPAWSPFITR